jgi:penicillin-insensitive murein endopeptidase
MVTRVIRVALLIAFSGVLFVGGLALSGVFSPRPAPVATAVSPPALQPAPVPPPVAAPPAGPTPEKIVAAPPAPAEPSPTPPIPAVTPPPAPTVAAPSPAPEAAPVVAAPAPKPEAMPVVTSVPAAEPAPAPVVAAPSAAPPTDEKVAAPAPEEQKVASAPPVAAPSPAVTAPPVAVPPVTITEPPVPPAAPTPDVVTTPPLPPKKPDMSEDKLPAKYLFSRIALPSLGKAMAIGYYPRGCLQGGVELPITGPTWQVMRLSRNRNWGHPELVGFLKRFAPLAAKATGWAGILIGDMAQPRGGPLPFGHLSHQIGLDVDIWYLPMPHETLSPEEREQMPPNTLVAESGKEINPKTWSEADAAFIRTAAEQPEVERIFVNAAIKKKLCEMQGKAHHAWMDKVRPWYGHDDHMHVRLKCPADSPLCRKQPPVPNDDGCSEKELAYWFSDKVLHPKKPEKPQKEAKPVKPAKPPHYLTLAELPPACKLVLDAPAKNAVAVGAN